jgi:predicted O-linked N-acetylglucosamine transferase (SPINDLY family)
MPEVSPGPAARGEGVTFGCLNSFAKVSQEAISDWLRILMSFPGSRLLLNAPVGSCRENIYRCYENGNVPRDRIEFVSWQPWEQYVQTLARIDIALDTFPYGGGVSTLDALWMGLPVVTLSGMTAVGRGGRSILSHLGLPELIADSRERYIEIATDLAADFPRLADLRATLRERMEASPLRDPKGHARAIEAAYREMWRRWCERKDTAN